MTGIRPVDPRIAQLAARPGAEIAPHTSASNGIDRTSAGPAPDARRARSPLGKRGRFLRVSPAGNGWPVESTVWRINGPDDEGGRHPRQGALPRAANVRRPATNGGPPR